MEYIKLEDQIIEDFTAYSTYVNEERAIPHLYDSLKPVARRVLYVMWKMKLTPDKQTKKCANIVGSTMAYHPHADSGIYGALVRLAQPFSVKVPLIYGQGNFGTEELGPAASRYTEAKLSDLGFALTAKLNKKIVPMHPNYDGTEEEPEFLFAPVPLLLNTGALGIGVGMRTSIPSHNLDEIIQATIHLIKNPNATTEDLLKFIKGPDFPSGCSVVNQEDFVSIYKKGKGSFLLRSTFEFSGNTLVIKNLPMYTIASKIEEQIYKAKENGELKQITKVINTTAQSQELTLQLKSKYDAEELIRNLCSLTDVERSFSMDLRAVDNGSPRSFTLLSYLRRWIEIHEQLTRKELQLELEDVNYKLEIAQGLRKALIDIDTIIETIKKSDNRSAAKLALQKLEFTENQANAILDIKLSRLTKLEAIELDKQIEDLLVNQNFLLKLLHNTEEFKSYVIDKMKLFLGYDKPRQSKIENTRFPKVVKVKQDRFYLTFSQGTVRITEEIPKVKHLAGSSTSPVFLLEDNFIIPVRNMKETVYTNIRGILEDKDVFHFSADGYVKRTAASELQVTRKAKITSQESVIAILQAHNGYALITTKSGKQVQFDLHTVPHTKRGAKGVIAVKLGNEQIEKVELIAKPLKHVPNGRNKTFK